MLLSSQHIFAGKSMKISVRDTNRNGAENFRLMYMRSEDVRGRGKSAESVSLELI